jgi:AmiR/NasT family two-component response regulator
LRVSVQPAPVGAVAREAVTHFNPVLSDENLANSGTLSTDVVPLKVLIADANPNAKAIYDDLLVRLGHSVSTVGAGTQLIEGCRLLQPGLLVVQARLPELDGVAAVAEICRERPLPIIMAVDSGDCEVVAPILEIPHVLAVLENPIRIGDLAAAVALAVRRFAQWQECREEVAAIKRSLEERKLIERAKGMVMRRTGLDEADAFRRMRRLASNRNVKLVEIAQGILSAEATFAVLEEVEAASKGAFGGNGRTRA